MDFLSVVGLLLVIAAGIGVVYLLKSKKSPMVESKQVERKTHNFDAPSVSKELESAAAQQTVTLTGEQERAIQASVSLHEMFQQTPSSSWSRTGAVSKALVLAGGVWIFKVPSREGGKPIWLRATELDAMSLMTFYKGKEGNPGPARIFKENGQSEPVAYELPKNLTPGITWEIIDIGTFDAEVDGECDNASDGDRLYFVTSREQGGDKQLLYLDARKGEARGSGGLFLGEKFDPSVEVSSLL